MIAVASPAMNSADFDGFKLTCASFIYDLLHVYAQQMATERM